MTTGLVGTLGAIDGLKARNRALEDTLADLAARLDREADDGLVQLLGTDVTDTYLRRYLLGMVFGFRCAATMVRDGLAAGADK